MLGNRPSAMQLLSQTHGTPRKMRSGGAVHGPGTGTSDSIPALLSNGEYVLPADTVATVGRPALDALRSLTHTPVQKFADGGLVDNPYGAVTRSGNSYSGMDVRGNISVNGSAPNGTYTENPAGRAAAAMSSLPAAAPAPAPSPVSAPAVSTGVSPTPAAQPGAAAAPMGWEQRNAMRNNAVTASSIVASPERDAARAALMGVMPGQAPTPGAPAPATAPVPGSAASQLATVPARRPLQYQGSSIPRYANGGLVGEEDPSGPLTRSTAVLAAQQPAQMSAQQVLSALPQAQAPAIRHSGNDWQARKDLANLQTAASSITNDRRWGGQGDRSDDRQAYQRALATDLALKGSAPEMEQAAMRENGANARAALADLGSTQRTSMEQAGAGARAQLADMGSTYRTNIEQSGAGARALLADTGAFRRQELENQGALDRQALQSAGAVQAAQIKAAAGSPAPSGYRYTPSGDLKAIPGGPGDEATKPLNDVQAKALQFGARMQTSSQNLERLAAKGVERPGDIKRAADLFGLGAAFNWTQSPEQQQVEQSQRDYVNAALRRESGAAIANQEFDNAQKQYFPQIGDTPEVIAQKRRNREIATAGILAEVPNADRRIGQVVGAGQPKQSQRPALDSFWEK